MDILEDPRYKDRPAYIFFEKYVMDIIGELNEEKLAVLEGLDLQQVFGTQNTEWRKVIEEALQLSKTIEIAVLDEWYKYADQLREQDIEPDPKTFTLQFVDSYFAEGSMIDVWPDQESLSAAIKRIESFQLQAEV